MNEIPENLKNSLIQISKDFKILLGVNTHHDINNMEISWVKGNTRMRVDFEYTRSKGKIEVTLYKDRYPFFPNLFIGVYGLIPFFPNIVKIEWKILDLIDCDQSSEYYTQRIKELIQSIIK